MHLGKELILKMEKIFYGLTNPQKSILLTEEYYKGTNINNICGTANIKKKINFNIMEQAINKVISKNDSFLLKFNYKNNKLVQSIKNYEYIPIELVNLQCVNDVNILEQKTLKHIFIIFC